jgi:hypothetical protein
LLQMSGFFSLLVRFFHVCKRGGAIRAKKRKEHGARPGPAPPPPSPGRPTDRTKPPKKRKTRAGGRLARSPSPARVFSGVRRSGRAACPWDRRGRGWGP